MQPSERARSHLVPSKASLASPPPAYESVPDALPPLSFLPKVLQRGGQALLCEAALT